MVGLPAYPWPCLWSGSFQSDGEAAAPGSDSRFLPRTADTRNVPLPGRQHGEVSEPVTRPGGLHRQRSQGVFMTCSWDTQETQQKLPHAYLQDPEQECQTGGSWRALGRGKEPGHVPTFWCVRCTKTAAPESAVGPSAVAARPVFGKWYRKHSQVSRERLEISL